jgi:hypothetical protein
VAKSQKEGEQCRSTQNSCQSVEDRSFGVEKVVSEITQPVTYWIK